MPLPNDPSRYRDAPRLPEGGAIDVRALLTVPTARLELEIGPGRGGFMLERLATSEAIGIIGLEVKRKWTVIVNERLARSHLDGRGRVLAEDARLALPRFVPDASLDAVYLHFPDPWWKKKHHKRLVVGTDLLDQAARLLRPGGELFVQTDVDTRAVLYEVQILAHAAFLPGGDAKGSPRVDENPYQARSHRERRAIADRIPIYRLRFVRKA